MAQQRKRRGRPPKAKVENTEAKPAEETKADAVTVSEEASQPVTDRLNHGLCVPCTPKEKPEPAPEPEPEPVKQPSEKMVAPQPTQSPAVDLSKDNTPSPRRRAQGMERMKEGLAEIRKGADMAGVSRSGFMVELEHAVQKLLREA